jgi:proteasome lid subunit RPN8/RPN11
VASDATTSAIRIPVWLWAAAIFDLRKRGAGKRESGAFLLGSRGGGAGRVTSYLCYDDIDPAAYQMGTIAFHAAGYAALWQHCKERKVEVLGDVHTHPGPDVAQSGIDQRHPMLPVIGHTALIVPNFGRTAWWSLKAVGVHEYLGSFKWRTHGPDETPRRIKLSLW